MTDLALKISSLDQSLEIVRRRIDEVGTNEPTIIKTEKGIKNHPKLIIKFLKNGKYKYSSSECSVK